jgi:hypothetical protein
VSANAREMMDQVTDGEPADATWKSLYKIGGAAIAMTLVFYLTQLVVFSVVDRPFPSTINDWFSLFQESRLFGLFYLNALDMASIALMGPMFLALYVALRPDSETWMAVAAFFAFTGIPIFIAPRAATLAMLPLSEQYAAATTEAGRSQILAVGEAVGALGQPTPQTVGFILIAVAVLISSGVMLRSKIFSQAIAYVGILASVLTFVGFISLVMVPSIAEPLMIMGMVPWMIWWILIARRLLQLGRLKEKTLPQQS